MRTALFFCGVRIANTPDELQESRPEIPHKSGKRLEKSDEKSNWQKIAK